MFDGTLGKCTSSDYTIELKEDAKPYHVKTFPFPKTHVPTLKKEVDSLIKIGVLRMIKNSQWAAPTFIISKLNGTFISDLSELNKRIKRKPFTIPNNSRFIT